METTAPARRIHPLVATAAVAVTLASLVGIAAMTGMIPSSYSGTAPGSTAPPPIAASAAGEAAGSADQVASKTAPAPAPVAVKHRTASHTHAYSHQPAPVAQAPAVCHSCGQVESIQAIQHAAPASGLGIAAGAVVGGLLGNQVGGGNGRTLATVAGAVGGGYAGNEVEKRTRSTTTYKVHVRMEDGTLRTFPQSGPNGWQVGDPVRVVNGALTARG